MRIRVANPSLGSSALRRFAKYFCVTAGWAAFGRPTSRNTKEKTSRAAARVKDGNSEHMRLKQAPLWIEIERCKRSLA